MKRIREVHSSDRDGFQKNVRGRLLAAGEIEEVDQDAKKVTDSTADFLGAGVSPGCYLIVTPGPGGEVKPRAVLIMAVEKTSVTVDEWVDLIKAGNRYQIMTAPVLAHQLRMVEYRQGDQVSYIYQDDGIVRENRVFRGKYKWLGGRSNSEPFYIPPGVKDAAIEFPYAHNNNVEFRRYYGDWLSLAPGDSVLLQQVGAAWGSWPLPASYLIVASGDPLLTIPGTYSMRLLYISGNWTIIPFLPPGWYRLFSNSGPGGNTTYTFSVVYTIPD